MTLYSCVKVKHSISSYLCLAAKFWLAADGKFDFIVRICIYRCKSIKLEWMISFGFLVCKPTLSPIQTILILMLMQQIQFECFQLSRFYNIKSTNLFFGYNDSKISISIKICLKCFV